MHYTFQKKERERKGEGRRRRVKTVFRDKYIILKVSVDVEASRIAKRGKNIHCFDITKYLPILS